MARLVSDVHVKDPQTRLMVHLRAGEEPAPEYAALVTNPAAWEDGKPPAAAKTAADKEKDTDSGAAESKPAAKRAARKPARGRDAAGEGDSGD